MKFSRLARRKLSLKWRVISAAMLPVLTVTSIPQHVWAAAADDTSSATPSAIQSGSNQPTFPAGKPQPSPEVIINRTSPKVSPPSASHVFSDSPADTEFFHAHLFSEPLVPIGGKTSAHENKALAASLTLFAKSGNAEATAPLTDFLKQYPNSAWKASLLTNLGILYRRTGYFGKALTAWEEAWNLSKSATGQSASGIADRAVGELAEMNARIGRFDRLEKLTGELDVRNTHGPGASKVSATKQGMWLMLNRPDRSFRCGPMALASILASQNPGAPMNKTIFNTKSSHKGVSLDQINALANEVGMSYQMAKREPGSKVIVPAVVNWKVGHYAAIVKEANGKYLVKDPTVTENIWISAQALDEEGSGYFLVPQGTLPQGWQTVDENEGKTIWGRGQVGGTQPPPPFGLAPGAPCGCSPMTTYTVDPSRINLMLSDTPVGYAPPVGPSVFFQVCYSQQEIAPVSVPTYSNLGPQWSCNWVGFIVDDPTNASPTSYGPSGGTLTYGGYNGTATSGTFAMQLESHAVLVRTGTSSYEQDFSDGSKEIYGLTDGAIPQKIYMTAKIDPAGNQLTYTYDSFFRLSSVTDATLSHKVTTISYMSDDPTNGGFYLISKVTDPFGRFASFAYNTSGQLTSITDIIGITSSFTYGTGDYVGTLTTPYGTTTFVHGGSGVDLSLKVVDPQGGTEFLQYDEGDTPGDTPPPDYTSHLPSQIGTEQGWEIFRNTYYWSKEAYAQGPGDRKFAKIMHWLHENINGVAAEIGSDTLESEKPALENRIYYNYPGQFNSAVEGTSNQPTKVARLLDDGSTQLYQYDYNAVGNRTQMIDPTWSTTTAGRVTTWQYDTNNIDLLAVYQENPSGKSTDGYGQQSDLLASYTYNNQHQPLTATDASRQTTTYSYNNYGQRLTVTDAKGETTNYAYDTNGYLQTVTGPTGAVTSYTYDTCGRVRTVTDPEGYSVTTDYDPADRPTQKTYPDGTTEQITYNKLDAEWTQDRLGRWTHIFHDALRHVVAVEDPLYRVTSYDWCVCGSLEAIFDPAGNRTGWTRDAEGRVTEKTFSDGSVIYSEYENTTSRLKTVTDALGQSTNYTYNIDNTLAQVSYTDAWEATPGVKYTYDPVYNRMATMTDVTGTTTYNYNPITATATLGAGRLGNVVEPLATIGYGYDELGRVVNRSIGSSVADTSNTIASTFDPMGRMSAIIINPLGAFNYTYVSASSFHLSAVNYPNGQAVNFAYNGNTGDQLLQEIKNVFNSVDVSGSMISQFDYAYNAVDQITSWQQNNSILAGAQTYGLNYDDANQLTGAALTVTGSSGLARSFAYGYDRAGNRTQEQINSSTKTSTFNNLNQLTGQSSGGLTHFTGIMSKWANVTVGGNPTTVTPIVTTSGTSYNFDGVANLSTGTTTVPIVAMDSGSNTLLSNQYQVVVPSGNSRVLVYDGNGNMLSDGAGRTFEWDAVNRLTAINYTGSGQRTEFTYNGLGQRVRIAEKDSDNNVVSTKQFVWEPGAAQPSEERDASNTVTKRFYGQGEQIEGNSYYFTRDHLGSVRELTDGNGTIHARYDYDLWGRLTKVSGDMHSDFAYAGYYNLMHNHAPSGLYTTLYRFYSPDMGRWISRDPIGEKGGGNLYGYVGNNPIGQIDLYGECACKSGKWVGNVSYSAVGLIYMHGSFNGTVTCTSDYSLSASVGGSINAMGIQVGYVTGKATVGFLADTKADLMNERTGILVATVGIGYGPINFVSFSGNWGATPAHDNTPGELYPSKPEENLGPGSDAGVSDLQPKPDVGFGAAAGILGLTINQVN